VAKICKSDDIKRNLAVLVEDNFCTKEKLLVITTPKEVGPFKIGIASSTIKINANFLASMIKVLTFGKKQA